MSQRPASTASRKVQGREPLPHRGAGGHARRLNGSSSKRKRPSKLSPTSGSNTTFRKIWPKHKLQLNSSCPDKPSSTIVGNMPLSQRQLARLVTLESSSLCLERGVREMGCGPPRPVITPPRQSAQPKASSRTSTRRGPFSWRLRMVRVKGPFLRFLCLFVRWFRHISSSLGDGTCLSSAQGHPASLR